MRTVLLVLALLTGVLLAAFVFQQFAVEGNLGPAALVASALLGAACLALVGSWFLAGTRHRDLVGRIWLALLATAVTYGVVDVVAGKLLIRPLSPPLVADAHRHHRLIPDSYAEFRQRDFAYVQRVNHLGLRGREVELEKPAGTVRVVMLGDSFTMGKGVSDDETFSVLLEGALAQALQGCPRRVEVINAGVDSYAPVLELIYLKRELQRLAPDIVVVNLDVSDLVQEQAYRRAGQRGPDGEVVAVPQRAGNESAYERFRAWTERNLFFTRVILFYANRALNYRDVSVRDVVTEASLEVVAHTLEGDRDRTKEWDDIFDSIGRLRTHTVANGADLLLALYPWAHQVSDTQWVPGRWAFMPEGSRPSEATPTTVRARAAAGGIPLVDAFPAFRARVAEEKLYFDHDMHWTAAGHRVMAGALERELLARYRDRWCATP